MADGCLSPSPQIDLAFIGTFPSPRALRATPILSQDYGNGLQNRSNGMYAPGPTYLPGSQLPSLSASDDGALAVLYIGMASWLFRFNYQTDDSNHPWEFIGGAPLLARRDAEGHFNPGGGDGWVTNLTGDIAGPSVTAPVNGIYICELGYVGIPAANGSRNRAGVSIANGTPTDNNTASVSNPVGAINGDYESATRMTQITASAGDAISLKYSDNGSSGTSSFNRRWIAITPIRCN